MRLTGANMTNDIQYICTAKRCVWRVWISENKAYCSKVKCPFGCVRTARRKTNDTERIKQSATSERRD